jgi:ferredoxin
MFEGTPQQIRAEELRSKAHELGADLVGFTAVDGLERRTPPALQPSTLAAGMNTFVVFAKRILRGVVWSRHLPTKQLAGGRVLRELDRIGGRLCDWLEERGHIALPVPAGSLDFERRQPEGLTPAGQGSFLLRLAAVEAGLATWGLNSMVLTEAFGPRIYLGGVMTRLSLPADPKIDRELCLGLEQCGRCAAICPEDAIPRRAPLGAPLDSVRGLDAAACARSSQPFAFRAFAEHVAMILEDTDGERMWTRMRGRKSGEIWTEMAVMKEAAVTGCSECLQVCPVGEDYAAFAGTPHRRADLPEEVAKIVQDGFVEICNVGPQVRRKKTWDFEEKK